MPFKFELVMYFLEISILLRFQGFVSISGRPLRHLIRENLSWNQLPLWSPSQLCDWTSSSSKQGRPSLNALWLLSTIELALLQDRVRLIRILVLVVRASLKEILVLLVQASLKDILDRTILWVDHNSVSDNRLSGWSTILVQTMHHIPS